ncbi:hypothetical protein [Sinorhizobium fredii]|uniref:hypothetical protein n=1 Tax=Rhizobium fredii TaxID=380 RepID=UPI00351343C5
MSARKVIPALSIPHIGEVNVRKTRHQGAGTQVPAVVVNFALTQAEQMVSHHEKRKRSPDVQILFRVELEPKTLVFKLGSARVAKIDRENHAQRSMSHRYDRAARQGEVTRSRRRRR